MIEIAKAMADGIALDCLQPFRQADGTYYIPEPSEEAPIGRPRVDMFNILIIAFVIGMTGMSTRQTCAALQPPTLPVTVHHRTVVSRLARDLLLYLCHAVRRSAELADTTGCPDVVRINWDEDPLPQLVGLLGIGRARRKNTRGLLVDALCRAIGVNLKIFKAMNEPQPTPTDRIKIRTRMLELATLIGEADDLVWETEDDPTKRRLDAFRAEFKAHAHKHGLNPSEAAWGAFRSAIPWLDLDPPGATPIARSVGNLAEWMCIASWFQELPDNDPTHDRLLNCAYLGVMMVVDGVVPEHAVDRAPAFEIDTPAFFDLMGRPSIGEVFLAMLHESARAMDDAGLRGGIHPVLGDTVAEVCKVIPLAFPLLFDQPIQRQNETLCRAIAENVLRLVGETPSLLDPKAIRGMEFTIRGDTLDELLADLHRQALARFGSIRKAAKALDVPRSTFANWIKQAHQEVE